MARVYYVRYGQMRLVGRFRAEGDADLPSGQAVVIRSRRGTELGEILAPDRSDGPPPIAATILRPAGPEDHARARHVAADAPRRLAACEAVFRDGLWPLQPIDVEPLIDEGRTVVYYLGPHRLDAAGLVAAFRREHGLDIWLEPVGRDEPETAPEPAGHGCGGCGTDGGGCGDGGCSTGGGCGSCAVKDLVRRRPAMAPR